MKIVLTGSGTGGHFYPLIAVAEALRDLSHERRILEPTLYFLAPDPYDQQSLFDNKIIFVRCTAGKVRRYFSFRNFFDLFKTAWGTITALITLFQIYPDVVVSKGGYTTVPVTLAANILRIPVIVHESDAKPGRANLFAASHAYRIAISFESSRAFFPKKVQDRIALTGIPIRKELTLAGGTQGGAEELMLDKEVPTVLILGGSSGSQKINEVVMLALSELTSSVNVIHQTGKANFADVQSLSKVALEKSAHPTRYHLFPYLNIGSMRKAVGASNLIISRAGSTAISEISLWKKPSILIPIPESISHDQRTNAYAYAHTGGAVVLEEANLTPHVLVSEVRRITGSAEIAAQMAERGSGFANADSARIIADEVLSVGLSHEPVAPV
jgi:UDP-N-acetylglucosamine--N-acetylmuramyl-(pentapeptide) pyrophosphoryl-undecaprenol N-acetylglucosamine transferase